MLILSINWTITAIYGSFILLLIVFVLNLENLAESKSKLGKYVFTLGFFILIIFILLNFLDGIFDFFSIHSKPINDEYYDHLIRK
jgi:hypothetical protein